MNTTKFVTAMAIMSLSATMAVAQPAVDAGTSISKRHNASAMHGKRGPGSEARRGGDAGPFVKIGLARRLETLTAEQKTKLESFVQENKAEAESLQKDFRAAMETARQSTDRDARREAMKDVRQKFKSSEEKVDAFLKGLLTEEQQSQMQQKVSGLRDRAANRVRKAREDNNNTTGTKAQMRGDWGRRGKKADGAKAGNKADGGKKHRRKHMKNTAETPASAATDHAVTTGTATSPFVHE